MLFKPTSMMMGLVVATAAVAAVRTDSRRSSVFDFGSPGQKTIELSAEELETFLSESNLGYGQPKKFNFDSNEAIRYAYLFKGQDTKQAVTDFVDALEKKFREKYKGLVSKIADLAKDRSARDSLRGAVKDLGMACKLQNPDPFARALKAAWEKKAYERYTSYYREINNQATEFRVTKGHYEFVFKPVPQELVNSKAVQELSAAAGIQEWPISASDSPAWRRFNKKFGLGAGVKFDDAFPKADINEFVTKCREHADLDLVAFEEILPAPNTSIEYFAHQDDQ